MKQILIIFIAVMERSISMDYLFVQIPNSYEITCSSSFPELKLLILCNFYNSNSHWTLTGKNNIRSYPAYNEMDQRVSGYKTDKGCTLHINE